MRTATLALALAFLPLAGCIAGTGSGATALELADVAKPTAVAWQPDAQLSGAFALEVGDLPASSLLREGDPMADALSSRRDARPGDGAAAQWGYVFYSRAAMQSYTVVVAANGSVAASFPLPGPQGDGATLESALWRIDSGEAWRIARDANETLDDEVRAGGTAVSLLLKMSGHRNPVWFLLAATSEGAGAPVRGAGVVVDAHDGSIVPLGELLTQWLERLLAVREYGEGRPILHAGAPTSSFDFTVEDEHGKLAVALGLPHPTPPGQRVTLTLQDPEGRVVFHLDQTRAPTLDERPASAILLDPLPGRYVVSLRLDPPGPSGALATAQASWCTDGMAFFIQFQVPACAALDAPSSQGPNGSDGVADA